MRAWKCCTLSLPSSWMATTAKSSAFASKVKALCDERRAPARVVAVARGVERVEAVRDRVTCSMGMCWSGSDLDAREVVKRSAALI